MAKNKNDYFKMLEQQVGYCVQASDLLQEIVSNYSASNVLEQKQKMHEIENIADELHHDIVTRLATEFITPIDQEDILGLVQIIDDITDSLDEVVMDFYMYNVTELPKAVPEMVSGVVGCVNALNNAVQELKNFKKPAKLRELLVKVNSSEGAADTVYFEAIRELFATETDPKKIIATKAAYESIENCCDLCEHAADVIEQVIIKNT